MASLDSLQISEEKKKYITEKLNPVLEDFVTECLMNLPADPLDQMLSFCERKENGTSDVVKENVRLQREVERLKAAVEEARLMVSSLAKQEAKSAEAPKKEAKSAGAAKEDAKTSDESKDEAELAEEEAKPASEEK
eukprot:gnl/MRDRNA2_/MRDRNA2_101806_c0_seq1.p2 gnl/MRDRNA2_/MRDRNA2_101806_c0~~gnl/MRDRNA2_/MRDRNA2_101806_c0_seq1.p2  ORF type:complete len:136 (-),score=60.57 gnl/MRDRNA2_/MRDRNA2_101806_c0_seq1:131-538(-)